VQDEDGLGEFNYQWFEDGVEIDNATQATYTLTKASVGKKISVEVGYTDGLGNPEAVQSPETEAVKNNTGLTLTGMVKITP
jgi:hypothetical protein